MATYVGSVDQGTSSTRFLLFDHEGNVKQEHQMEHTQYHPHEGWTEHDPMEIINNAKTCMDECVKKAGVSADQVKAIGVTNQRETTVAWDSETGKPLCRAVVWHDLRTADIVKEMSAGVGIDRFRKQTGLPLSTYFAAVKMRWMINNVPEVAAALQRKTCLFGTIDTWLVYNLTGGLGKGVLVTDIGNASRTMLMDLSNNKWSQELCDAFGVPIDSLASIRSNSEVYGHVVGTKLEGVPVSCTMGDQQASTLGQGCIQTGQVKNTYGTGCFIFMNTGKDLVPSQAQLLSTVLYQLGPQNPITYGLEGAVACAGSSVQWLRDQLKMIEEASDMDKLASTVDSTGGVMVVPAFSGLLAPHWRPDARGSFLGMTFHTSRAHIARALLEGVALQVTDVLTAMDKDLATTSFGKAKGGGEKCITDMRVDGGMTKSEILMQTQADLLDFSIHRANMAECTAFGSAFAAGLAVGFWEKVEEAPAIVNAIGRKTYSPNMPKEEREAKLTKWAKAVELSWSL